MSWQKRLDDLLRGKTDWQMRRKAARFRAARRGAPPPSDDPCVVFAVPLVSRRRATDWGQVQCNLNDTLQSFLRQTDPRWHAVICGQNAPDLPDDPRIRFLTARVGDKYYDKGNKRRILIGHISATLQGDGYYMQFDADDILHPDAVRYMRGDHNGRGYVIEQGYFVSLSAGAIAPMKAFHKACGSSSAVYVDFRRDRRHMALLREHRSHTKVAEICEQFGQPLDPIPYPAALYMTGHGENMIQRRGKLDERTERRLRDALPPEQARAVLHSFGLDRVDWL